MGKFFIQACITTPCMLCGAEEIWQTMVKELGIKDGETTPDGILRHQEQVADDYYVHAAGGR